MQDGVWYHPKYDVICLCKPKLIEFQADTMDHIDMYASSFMLKHAYPSLDAHGWVRIGEYEQ